MGPGRGAYLKLFAAVYARDKHKDAVPVEAAQGITSKKLKTESEGGNSIRTHVISPETFHSRPGTQRNKQKLQNASPTSTHPSGLAALPP